MAICVLFISLLLLTIFLALASRGRYRELVDSLESKQYPFKRYIPIGLFVMEKLGYSYSSKYDRKLFQQYTEIVGQRRAQVYLKINWGNKITLLLLGLLFVTFISSVLFLQENAIHHKNKGNLVGKGEEISRPSFGQGETKARVKLSLESGKIKREEELYIPIKEMPPQTEDEKAVAKIAEKLTEEFIKGKNKSLKSVEEDLFLPASDYSMGNLGVKISWSSKEKCITSNGKVELPPYGSGNRKMILDARLEKGEVVLNKSFQVTLMESKRIVSDEQKVIAGKRAIEKKLKEGDLLKVENQKVLLPKQIEKLHGLYINWIIPPSPQDHSDIIFLLFGVGILILLLILLDQDISRKIKKRRESIQMDFPDFLNKFILLVNAGLSISRVWGKISEESEKKTPLYMELALTLGEIKSGRPEIKAYEDFALRCRVMEVTKFVSVIEQSLRKGNKELVTVLRLQAGECWQMRKNTVKRLGEEASTKMLLPLMLMFIAIVLIVATPAIIALQGL